MKTRTLITTLAAAAVLTMAAVSFAGPHGGPGRGYGYGCGAGFAAADLTEEQQAAVKVAYEEHARKLGTVGQDLYAKHLELEAELAKAAPDAKKVAALTKEVNDLRGTLFAEQTAFRARLAKDFGIRGGGAGCGMMGGRGMAGHGMGRGMMMGQGYGPGSGPNFPAWNAPGDGKAQ